MRKIKRKMKDWVIILGISILASVPLLAKGIYKGHDIGFHLLRIEGIADELKRGQFPVRMQSLWLEGYGYPVSIYYGDILLYAPATLRLLGVSVTAAYKVYILLINIATAAVSYFCFDKIWTNRRIAAIVSLAYVTSGYRMVDIYVRAAVGEYSAMIFFPLIALSICKIYMSKEYGKAEYRQSAFLLCLGMTGLLENHILSTEMAIFVLILVCIVLWKRTFREKIILTYFLAIAETLFLNLYFIVPFLDYYCNVCANITVSTNTGVKGIQQMGAYPIQYISFFQNIFGLSSIGIHERMQLSPGPLLMFSLILGLIIYIKKKNKKIFMYMIFSLLMLFWLLMCFHGIF